MKVRPGNVLVAIRDPRNLYYLNDLLKSTDTAKQDIVVMTARIYHREPSFSGSATIDSQDLFEDYERQMFTKVVELAEKQGKHVALMVVPSANVFDAILQTASRLESSKIVCGLSNRLTLDEQGKLTGDAWERLPEPRPNVVLEICSPDHAVEEYFLGPHTPRLRDQDLKLLHDIWLEVSEDPELASLHHYHIVGMALERLKERLHGSQREEILALLKKELQKPDRKTAPRPKSKGSRETFRHEAARPSGRAVLRMAESYSLVGKVWEMRSCQQSSSSSTRAQRNPRVTEAKETNIERARRLRCPHPGTRPSKVLRRMPRRLMPRVRPA